MVLVVVCLAAVTAGIVIPSAQIPGAIILIVYLRAGGKIIITGIVPPITTVGLTSGAVGPSITPVLCKEFPKNKQKNKCYSDKRTKQIFFV